MLSLPQGAWLIYRLLRSTSFSTLSCTAKMAEEEAQLEDTYSEKLQLNIKTTRRKVAVEIAGDATVRQVRGGHWRVGAASRSLHINTYTPRDKLQLTYFILTPQHYTTSCLSSWLSDEAISTGLNMPLHCLRSDGVHVHVCVHVDLYACAIEYEAVWGL